MDDDMDIEAMLDAPLKESRKQKEVSPPAVKESKDSKEKEEKSHKKSKKHKRSRSRSKKRKHKSRSRSRSKERRHKSSRDRRRSRSGSRSRRTSSAHAGSVKKSESHHRSSREHGRSGGGGGGGGGRGGGGGGGRRSSRSRSGSMHWRFKEGEEQVKQPDPGPRNGDVEIPPEERDKRTVFCMQLHTRLRARDLEEFFSQVGRVRDVRIISDRNSRRCKGIAYIEFFEEESVAPALKLTGTKIMGIPIQVQHTQAEKNRAAMLANMAKEMGPTRLYVGSLHFNITEQMLRAIFEPFGYIDTLQLMIDPETNRSKGYGFVQYRDAESARRARDQLNGFELAGRPIKVGEVTEQMEKNQNSILDDEETDRGGIEMNANARIQLMAKLASGNEAQKKKKAGEMSESDLQNKVREMFGSSGGAVGGPLQTECFMLSNMFDPANETEADWADDIRSDVIAECDSFGGAVHVSVDKSSPDGNVYVKAPNTTVAMACVNSLQGRWFSGKMIKAAYLTVPDYSRKFAGTDNLRRKLER